MGWFDENGLQVQGGVSQGGYPDQPQRLDSQQPAAPTPAAPPTTTTGGGQDPIALIKQYQQSHPPTTESVQGLVAFLRQNGIQAALATHAGGSQASADKIALPDGRLMDVGSSVESPGGSWALSHEGNVDPSMKVVDGSGNFVPFSDYLSANKLGTPTYQFQGANDPARGATLGNYGGGASRLYNPDNLDAGWTEEFQAPTGADIEQTPGYQFIKGEGLKAIDRDLSAEGTVLTGKREKAGAQYATNLASTFYGQGYDRKFKEYQDARDTFLTNQNNLFGRYTKLADYGQTANGQGAAAAADASRSATDTITGIGNVQAAGQIGSAKATSSFLQGAGEDALTFGTIFGSKKPKSVAMDDEASGGLSGNL